MSKNDLARSGMAGNASSPHSNGHDFPPVASYSTDTRIPISSITTPSVTFSTMTSATVAKVEHAWAQTAVLAFLAGAYIGLGGLLSLICGTMPGVKETNPGLQKLVFGGVFPIGLLIIVVTGAELFTSNVLVIGAWLDKRVTVRRMLCNLTLVWVMNFVGAVWLAAMVYWSDIITGPFAILTQDVVNHKVNQPVNVSFCKGIMCNWLVCLAIYLASAANDLPGKAIGVWLPIMAFVAMGFDHCVANMFFLPLGLMVGSDYNFGEMLYRNIWPVTVGNFIGSLLVSTVYAFLEKRTRWQRRAAETKQQNIP